jgi:hypothetical protein
MFRILWKISSSDCRLFYFCTLWYIWLLSTSRRKLLPPSPLWLNYFRWMQTEKYLSLSPLPHSVTAPSWQGPPHYRDFTTTLTGHTTLGRNPLEEWSARNRDLCLRTQQSQETDIHATGGIRSNNPNKRVAADPRLRARGHYTTQYKNPKDAQHIKRNHCEKLKTNIDLHC